MPISIDRLRQELTRQREMLLAELAESEIRANEGMGYSTHPADDGTVAFEQAADMALRQNTSRLLYQVERALTRMEEGIYGICRNCSKSIDPARLEAIPYTRLCMSCANHQEED
jgi:RNA polymerase-binding protein DksA